MKAAAFFSKTGRFLFLVAGSLAISICLVTSLWAAEDKQRKSTTRETIAMSERVYKKLKELQDLIEQKSYTVVDSKLANIKKTPNLSNYELAQIHNISGYFFYVKGRYQSAIEDYEQLLQKKPLPDGLVQSTLMTISQLYFVTEQYAKALASLQQLAALVTEPGVDILWLLGQAYYQLQRFDEAIVPIKMGIDIYRRQGNIPKENWLLLLRAIYHEKNDYRKVLEVLGELSLHYPKNQYFMALAGIYSELGETKNQLVIMESLYETGYLSKSADIINLASLYLIHDIPYKAAIILERETVEGNIESNVRNLSLLTQAWQQAREYEKAIPHLEMAAKKSKDGELYVRLAQSYIHLTQWEKATLALRKGTKKGGIDRTDNVNIMLGTALFNLNRLEQATTTFELAKQDKRSSKTAGEWLVFIEAEKKRQQELAQSMQDRSG